MKRITELSYMGRTFVVVDLEQENEFGYTYGTIDREFIKNGKITKQLNGFQMMAAKSVDEAIKMRKAGMDYVVMKEQGMSDKEILMKMMSEE